MTTTEREIVRDEPTDLDVEYLDFFDKYQGVPTYFEVWQAAIATRNEEVKELEAEIESLKQQSTDRLIGLREWIKEYEQLQAHNADLRANKLANDKAHFNQLAKVVDERDDLQAKIKTLEENALSCERIEAALNGSATADEKKIKELEAQLSKFQTSEFNPDWSMLQASQESLREHMAMVQELQAQLAMKDEAVMPWLEARRKFAAAVSAYNDRVAFARKTEGENRAVFGQIDCNAEYQLMEQAKKEQYKLADAMFLVLDNALTASPSNWLEIDRLKQRIVGFNACVGRSYEEVNILLAEAWNRLAALEGEKE